MTIKAKIKFKTDNKPINYQKALDFMENHIANVIDGKEEEMIWLTSHQPIYTAGISAKESDLLKKDIPIIKTNRGGKYTYHDQGMRIIYVMLNLKNCFYPNKPDVSKFVKMLENWVIAILKRFAIKGEIRKDRIGIWVICPDGKERKIAAIGIKLKKWVSYHGIAINLNPDLEAFKAIIPCGIKEFGVTSFKELRKEILMEKIDQVIEEEFFKIFGNYSLITKRHTPNPSY